jgi:hypothetical protein
MKKTLRYTKNPENIQNPIVNPPRVTKWGLLKKRLVDLIRTVTATLSHLG